MAFIDCLEDNFSLLSKMETPFLALHGSQDWLCNPKGSRSDQIRCLFHVQSQHFESSNIRMLFDSAVAVEDKEIHVFEGAAHQLYLERKEVREDAVRRTVEWVMKRAADW